MVTKKKDNSQDYNNIIGIFLGVFHMPLIACNKYFIEDSRLALELKAFFRLFSGGP